MNDRQYYHAALECALLDSESLEKQINARIARLPNNKEVRVRFPKRLVIALVAAATLLIASVAVAAAITRNQAFKEQTNAVLDETIQTVTQPHDTEQHEGWQPNHLILFDDVQSTKEDVSCPVAGGVMQLIELGYVGSEGIIANFFYHTERDAPFRINDLTVSVNGGTVQSAYETDQFVYTEGHYCGGAYFKCDGNPLWPRTIFTFTGSINDEPFTLNYTFTEKTYQTLQQSIVDAVNEHKEIVERIPDQGTPVGYQLRNTILSEVAVRDRCMYFTTLRAPDGHRYAPDDKLPYSRFDRGIWPVIDGRTGEYYYLGNIDAENPEGTVYCTCLPYNESTFPEVSLIAFGGIMFRYEWATGSVTLPKDQEEYEAWRRESMELSAQLCEADWIWQFDEKLGDVQVTDLVFHTLSMWSEIGIMFESEQGFSDGCEPPKVWLNGVELVHVGEIDPLSSTAPFIRSDGKELAYCMVGYSPADLEEMFTLSVEWRGSRTEITLRMADVLRADAQEIKEYKALFRY